MGTKQDIVLTFLAALSLLLATVAGAQVTAAESSSPTGCWRVVPSPNINGEEVNITRLTLASNGELWAISSGSFMSPPQSYEYILHHNNGGWDTLPGLPLTYTYGLAAAKVFSSSDLWVMVTLVNEHHPEETTEHWEGRLWRIV